jgi:MioC protein
MKIALLYGTESGNAEMLCEDLRDELDDAHDVEMSNLADVAPEGLNPDTFYILVTSTHGNGDLPAGAAEFADAVEEQKPDFSGIFFAIFGLGDMVFEETFNQGSERLMNIMLAQKAGQIGDRGIHDASTGEMPEDIAIPWLQTCMAQFTAQAA